MIDALSGLNINKNKTTNSQGETQIISITAGKTFKIYQHVHCIFQGHLLYLAEFSHYV